MREKQSLEAVQNCLKAIIQQIKELGRKMKAINDEIILGDYNDKNK